MKRSAIPVLLRPQRLVKCLHEECPCTVYAVLEHFVFFSLKVDHLLHGIATYTIFIQTTLVFHLLWFWVKAFTKQVAMFLVEKISEDIWVSWEMNLYALSSLQQVQVLIEHHLAILDTEDWGSGLLCAGVWPDGFPSAFLSTEDSCFSAVLRDGQVLLFCLNTLSMQGKR